MIRLLNLSIPYSVTSTRMSVKKPVFRADIGMKVELARGRKGDLFGGSAKRNVEPFAELAVFYVVITSVFFVAIMGALVFGVVYALHLTYAFMLLPLPILAVGAGYGVLYLKTYLFTLEDGYFFVRRGVWVHSYTLIPYENIQDIHVVQGIIERLLGLTTLTIFTATTSGAGAESVPWLPRESAEKIKTALFKRMKEGRNVTD